MTAERYQLTVVALLDKPSTDSFGMTGLIVKIGEIDDFSEIYRTTGLAPKNRMVTAYELNRQLGSHILEVQSPLPSGLLNPVALWMGSNFYTKATELKAPTLPMVDDNWYSPPAPDVTRGKYTITESKKAYKILDDWVTEAAKEALVRNCYDLAVLTRWTLPIHPATKAALYYTAPTTLQRAVELEWQLATDRKISAEKLIQEHEEVREKLLERKF